jgi:hypothetical protein
MQASEKTHFLIDGFPKNKDNVDGWQSSDPMQSLFELQRNGNEELLLFLSPDGLHLSKDMCCPMSTTRQGQWSNA